jgi:catechol 2,3-dioxygenase-like lactoylglutathione lyase family enzyme
MTAMRGQIAATTDPDALGVHSLDHFTLAVPDLKQAQDFYTAFGLDLIAKDATLALNTFGHEHSWGFLIEGPRKALHHLAFGCYADDLAALKGRIEGQGVTLIDPPPGFPSNGFWFRDPWGVLIEVKVAPKVTPDKKTGFSFTSAPEGVAANTVRAKAPAVRPRRLSHVLTFLPDIEDAVRFYSATVGLRLSDRSGMVAFMHGIHGSDHHILAFAKSPAPGFHHCSWDVGRIDDIGLGAMCMADKGFNRGWGLGRHVLGSNYFHYVRDPWGSYSEYSCDIDFIPAARPWQAGEHADEDSFYQWGPVPPEDFAFNYEGQK